ncbi:MAG: hypothetical protein ABSF81_12195 [Bacteroidales bacterium]
MKKVKIIAGICWAFLCLILIIILFPGLNSFSVSVSKLPFMKLNPRYTGGEVANQMITESCTLDIRKPVFNGFLRERNSGFVQMDWRGTLPEMIKDSIDYDHDGKKDFCVLIDRKDSKTVLNPFNRKVKGVLISTLTSYGWAVRVELIK